MQGGGCSYRFASGASLLDRDIVTVEGCLSVVDLGGRSGDRLERYSEYE